MEDIVYTNSLYQVNEILKYISPNLKARIPKKIISYFETNKSKDYNWNIDKTLPLEKQELLPTTKEILTVLYRDYMCDEMQKFELDKILNDNEIKYQSELREKYNPENIFKNKERKLVGINNEDENDKSMIGYKETFLSKIVRKIKLLFYK